MKEKSVVDKVFTHGPSLSLPAMLSFQNGNMDGISKENTKFSRVTHGKRKGAILVAGDQIYHGEFDCENQADKLTDTYICVRNKHTHKVSIIPIEEVLLNNHVYSKLDGIRKLPDLTEDYSKQKLMKEFGGRKAARFIANQEKIKMDINSVKNELDTTVQETVLGDQPNDTVEMNKHFDIIRPPFNKDAEKLDDVYKVNDVVSLELLERLEEEAKTVHTTPVEHIPISSEYLLNHIRTMQKSNASPESILRIKLIIYMDCLKNLITSRVRKLTNLEMSQITEKVENDVRKRFTDPNIKTFMKTSLSTEKALCHFIVLALLIEENYQVNINVLAQELNMARQKVTKYAQIVNAKRKGQTDLLTLCLPKKVGSLPMKFKRRFKN